jgi:putative phosphotransacetylase
LFGHDISKFKDLYQPGYWAANEAVTVVGPRDTIENIRVLGPYRSQTQVELSQTDLVKIGIKAPARRSGNLEGSPGCTIVGPKGVIKIPRGLIRAWRHVHMSEEDAYIYGVGDGDTMRLTVESDRSLTFHGVVAIVGDFKLEAHIDTDEANACDLSTATHFSLMRWQDEVQRTV